MSPLHGLRLNCLLAPLIVAVIGAAAVMAGSFLHRAAAAEAARDHATATLRGLARLAEAEVAPPLPTWLAAQAGWSGVARVTIAGEALTIHDRAGEVPLGREATPEMMLGYQAVQCWTDGERLAVAAPCLPRQGAASVVVGWCDLPATPSWWPWLGLAGGVLVLGGGLGAYLVVRVYRPVEWMDRAAAAAASGQSEPPGGVDSPETASLRSSIAMLIEQRSASKPSGPVDAPPAP